MSLTQIGFSGEIPNASSFLFEVDGITIGTFGEVSGLEMTVDVATYQEGGVNGFVHQLPGRMSWPHIVLKRGITQSDALFNWVNQTTGSKVSRCTGAITVVGTNGSRLRTWSLQEVIAVRWAGPRFAVGESGPVDEELELAHHGFTSKTFSSGS